MGLLHLIRTTFLILISFQAIGGLLFSFYFKVTGYYDRWSDAFFNGFYQAISAVTNSGFDVTGHSILPYSTDYPFLFGIMFLIFIGGIGFPVIMDFRSWLIDKLTKKKLHQIPYRFSLFYENYFFLVPDFVCRWNNYDFLFGKKPFIPRSIPFKSGRYEYVLFCNNQKCWSTNP